MEFKQKNYPMKMIGVEKWAEGRGIMVRCLIKRGFVTTCWLSPPRISSSPERPEPPPKLPPLPDIQGCAQGPVPFYNSHRLATHGFMQEYLFLIYVRKNNYYLYVYFIDSTIYCA